MGKCLTILTFTETKRFPNGETYQDRQHLGLALIKPSKDSDEIITLMRIGYPDQYPEELYGVNSVLEQLPMLGVEVVYEETTKEMANRLLNEAKRHKVICNGKVVTLQKFFNLGKKDEGFAYEIAATYNVLVKIAKGIEVKDEY
jgi:hypothetical protein